MKRVIINADIDQFVGKIVMFDYNCSENLPISSFKINDNFIGLVSMVRKEISEPVHYKLEVYTRVNDIFNHEPQENFCIYNMQEITPDAIQPLMKAVGCNQLELYEFFEI